MLKSLSKSAYTLFIELPYISYRIIKLKIRYRVQSFKIERDLKRSEAFCKHITKH